jgi:GNAT superfamily N-acetyltransferase
MRRRAARSREADGLMNVGIKLKLERITAGQAGLELDILNSDTYFNEVCNGKPLLSAEDALEKKKDADEIGAERYFMIDGGTVIGILDYLLHNPGDGYAWLGLLLIRKELQGKGYGLKALQLFEDLLRERSEEMYRIGVIVGNEPAQRFWNNRGFIKVKTVLQDNRQVDVYEKRITL